MKTITLKSIKSLVKSGVALDITTADEKSIPEELELVNFSTGAYGVNGGLFRGTASGTLYAITKRNSNLFRFI